MWLTALAFRSFSKLAGTTAGGTTFEWRWVSFKVRVPFLAASIEVSKFLVDANGRRNGIGHVACHGENAGLAAGAEILLVGKGEDAIIVGRQTFDDSRTFSRRRFPSYFPSKTSKPNEKTDREQKTDFDFGDFFHLESIAVEHEGFKVLSMEEFLRRMGTSGKLANVVTGAVGNVPCR